MEELKKLLCPFTKKVISDTNSIGSYLRWTSKKKGIPRNELKYLIYETTYGDIITKDTFKRYYEELKYSLPMFLKEFALSYDLTIFLIDYHNCRKRTFSESTRLGAIRSKQTNLKRYGVDQTFKVPEFRSKRKATYLAKYGVDNPFKIKNFIDLIESTYEEKYGCSVREFKSRETKARWASLSGAEREKLLNKTVLSSKCRKSFRRTSNLEWRIAQNLLFLRISFLVQFKLKKDSNKYYFYDFLLPEQNLIFEVNGNWSHACPNIYKPDDLLPIINKSAEEIWDYDRLKIETAEKMGYKVIVIWEDDLKFKSNKDVQLLLSTLIANYEIGQNQINKENRPQNNKV